MNLKTKLNYVFGIFGLSLSLSVHAVNPDLFVFGGSTRQTHDIGLNITTSSGSTFVTVSRSGWYNNLSGQGF